MPQAGSDRLPPDDGDSAYAGLINVLPLHLEYSVEVPAVETAREEERAQAILVDAHKLLKNR